MRSGSRLAVLALLLALCAGCRHRRPAPPPQQTMAPALPTPEQTAQMIPPLSPLPAPPPSSVVLNTAIPPETSPTEHHHHRPLHHRARPVENPAPETKAPPEPAATAATQQIAASGQPSAASPIGQLSSAGGNTSPADRESIAKMIDSTANGLKGIKRPLSATEQKTAAQIRAFLEHARASLAGNDVEGAHTLAVKAQLLLEELTKQEQ